MRKSLRYVGMMVGLTLILSMSMVARGQGSKVVYYSMFSEGELHQQALAKAIEGFNAANPDTPVEATWAGRDNLTQLQSLLAAGDQVDIVDHSDDRVYNAVVASGLALPLDSYLDAPAYGSETPWKDTFVPAALTIGKSPVDGKTYMIPREDYISAYFYNTAVLKDVGITPAVTGMSYDDFTAMLKAIQDKGVTPLAADGTVSFYNNWYTTYLQIRLAGVDAYRAAAYDKTGESWKAPEFLKAAQMLRALQDAGDFQKGFEGSVWPAAQVQWVNGNPAMIFMGAWLPAEMKAQMPPGFTSDMFAFPNVEGGKGNDVVEHWANVFAVMKDSTVPDAAVNFLKYVMSPDVVKTLVANGTPVPIVGAPVPPGLENQYKILGASTTIIPARAGLNTEIAEYMNNVYNVCTDRFFQLQDTPEAYVECLATSSAAYWSAHPEITQPAS